MHVQKNAKNIVEFSKLFFCIAVRGFAVIDITYLNVHWGDQRWVAFAFMSEFTIGIRLSCNEFLYWSQFSVKNF